MIVSIPSTLGFIWYTALARISHTLAAHLANHLAASGFVLPHHINLDTPGRPHPGDQSITQSEPPECEISGLKIIKYNRCFSLWTSEEIERCVIASFRIEESVGFKGEFRQWEHLLRVGD